MKCSSMKIILKVRSWSKVGENEISVPEEKVQDKRVLNNTLTIIEQILLHVDSSNNIMTTIK